MLKRFIENYLFSSRWLLTPFLFILTIGLVGIMLKTARNTIKFLKLIYTGNDEHIKVELLELIDMTLIAALVIIVIISVYANFISRINYKNADGGPEWMTSVDFGQLKLKLLTTLVAISAIRLLEVFMEVPKIDDRDLYFYIALHLTFVFSRLAMAFSPRSASGDG